MSMPHTCRCGVCGREMSELFRTPIIPTFGGAAPALANEFGISCSRHGYQPGRYDCEWCAAEKQPRKG